MRLRRRPEKIAVLCASRIGDFLCATPGFRALKNTLPGARLTLIGLPFVREMAERNPYLDEFVPFPGFPGIAEQFFDCRKAVNFFGSMQRRNFDLAVQMHGSGLYSNTFTLMLGARSAAGFVRPGDRAGRLDAALTWPAGLPASQRALALAVFLGAVDCGRALDFSLFGEDHQAAEILLRNCLPPFIGLHPGSREPGKMWPEERFAEAGSTLRRTLGGTLVVIGGPDEWQAGERILNRTGKPALNLAGRRPLAEMGAVIARLAVLMTNDSGPAHMAYALGVPSVTLFGETDPAEWGPSDLRRHLVLRASDRRLASIPAGDAVRAALAAAMQAGDRNP